MSYDVPSTFTLTAEELFEFFFRTPQVRRKPNENIGIGHSNATEALEIVNALDVVQLQRIKIGFLEICVLYVTKEVSIQLLTDAQKSKCINN